MSISISDNFTRHKEGHFIMIQRLPYQEIIKITHIHLHIKYMHLTGSEYVKQKLTKWKGQIIQH